MKKALFIAVLMISQGGVSFSKESGTQSVFNLMDSVKRYCSESNTSHSAECLSAYFSYRCTVNYLTSDPAYIVSCINATSDLVNELDLTQVEVDPSKVNHSDPLQLRQVAFTQKLIKTFLTPPSQFKAMIDRYIFGFDRAYRFSEPYSLWKQALQDSAWKREDALRTIVTLFQDFASPGYLQFLEQEALASKNKWKRDTILENTRTIAEFYLPFIENKIKKNNNPDYLIYPKLGSVKHLTPLAHHFYTPAYLALRLKKLGYDSQTAFYAAFLFNSSYEFIKLDKKMNTHRWPLQDPLPFSAVKYSLQAEKIYTGYLGALYGVGMEHKALNYQYFLKRLSASPGGFVSSVHHYGF